MVSWNYNNNKVSAQIIYSITSHSCYSNNSLDCVSAEKMRTLLLWFVSLSFASAWELPSFLSQSFEFDESLTSPRELYVVNETMLEVAGDAYLRQLNATQEYEEDGNQTNSTQYVVTDSPTESPAPSPSPSEMPTNHPTITARKSCVICSLSIHGPRIVITHAILSRALQDQQLLFPRNHRHLHQVLLRPHPLLRL